MGVDQMSVVNRQFAGFEEIHAAEKAVDVAAAAMDAARDRLCEAAEFRSGLRLDDWPPIVGTHTRPGSCNIYR